MRLLAAAECPGLAVTLSRAARSRRSPETEGTLPSLSSATLAMAANSSSSSTSAPNSGPSLMDTLFQRTLDDLIKLLRSSSSPSGDAPSVVLSRALADARREIRSSDPSTKSVALQKLTFLSSLHGVDLSWASFHPLELLPSPIFLHKRLAYLAASLSFHPSTSVLPLATHQLRKDLSSPSDPVSSLALSFLASPAPSDELARHLSPDISPLLSSSRTRICAKASAAALRLFALYPDALRISFRRLVDNLGSPDPRVVSTAVGVFCELSASDPAPYLPLAPEFYRLLIDCRSNWVLIKVVKIFGRLAPLEPRLARRIVEPVCDHMRRSLAKSLVFECVRIVFTSLDGFDDAVRLAVEKVKEFLVAEDDPNLRYLGLKALSMLRPMHAWAVEESRMIVIRSLGDADPNIQREALHLIMGMVTEANLIDISALLVKHAMKSDPEFCNVILGAILLTCSRNFYEIVVNFDWYVSLLGNMARNPHCAQGEEIERQLVDICMRVSDARPELVHVARNLLIDPALLGNHFLCRILSAAAWVSGEFVEFSSNPVELAEALLQPRTSLLPVSVRAVYIQSLFKVLIFFLHSYIEQEEAGRYVSAGDQAGGSQTAENPSNANLEITYDGDRGEMCDLLSGSNIDDVQSAHKLNETVTKGYIEYNSVKYMLNLIQRSLDPLLEINEVELQERAKNLLGFIRIFQEPRSNLDEQNFKTNSRFIQSVLLMVDAFSEELGPIPSNSQERVLVPDGLFLKDDLSELANMLDLEDVEPTSAPVFSVRSHQLGESKEDLASVAESSSLLSEHRRQHGLYYLPTERDETEYDAYPRANEPQLSFTCNITNDSIDDLLKLTEQSHVPRKSKPRPVVVKLDEGENVSASSPKPMELKEGSLSGVVHDLLRNGDEPTTSRNRTEGSTRSNRPRGTQESHETISQSNVCSGEIQHVKNSSRTKHRSHGKDKVRSADDNVDKVEGKSHKSSHRSSHHRRHKHREKSDASVNVELPAPVVQDFLL